MGTASQASRIVGVLIIMQMVGSGVMNFVLEAPLFKGPGFLLNAAPHSKQIALAVLIGLVTGALWVGIAITMFPIFFPRSQALALWLIALAVVILGVAIVENIGVMSMVSLSEAYTKATTVDCEQFEGARVVVAAARNWPHYIGRIFIGCATFVLYAALNRFTLVPRALAALGLIASVLMVMALVMPLFGYQIMFLLLAPMGLTQLTLAVWLLTKGLRDQPEPQ